MRRYLPSVRIGLAAALAALSFSALSRPVSAQAAADGIFLLLPVGARAVGMGETVVAQQGGSDELWWNPAAIAGAQPHEVAIHHSETVVGQGNSLALVWPTKRAGTFGVSLNVLDLGSESATDDQGNTIGVITPTDVSYGLTYAAAPVKEFAVRSDGQTCGIPRRLLWDLHQLAARLPRSPTAPTSGSSSGCRPRP